MRMCEIVRKQDMVHLVCPLTGSTRPKPRRTIEDFRAAFPPPPLRRERPSSRPARKGAFVNHLISPDYLRQVDPSLEGLTFEELRAFVLKMDPVKRTSPYSPVRIQSPMGSAIDFILYPLCVISEQMAGYITAGNLDEIREDVEERVKAARDDGCEVVGLGMYASIVTNNGLSLRVPDITVTTGNSLTVAMALEAMDDAVATKGWTLADCTAVLVGAAGNIASTYASFLAERTTRLILVGSERAGSMNRVRRTAEVLYEEAFREIQERPAGPWGALARFVREEPLVKEWLVSGAPANCGRVLSKALEDRLGDDLPIRMTTDIASIRQGDVVVCSANAPEPFLDPGEFKAGSIVCDIAVPPNVMRSRTAQLADLTYQQGGIVATPNGESLP